MTHSTIDTRKMGDAVNRYGPTSARPAPANPARLSTLTVDSHAHVVIPAAAKYIATGQPRPPMPTISTVASTSLC